MSTGSMPKPGDAVSVTLHNKETIEGTVEWVDGNGAWIKGTQRARWVPIEYFLRPDLVNPPPKPAGESAEKVPKARKEESESEE